MGKIRRYLIHHSPYFLLCVGLLYLIGFPTVLWHISHILFLFYIPIGIAVGIKFWHVFQNYCRSLEKKEDRMYQKALKEMGKGKVPITKDSLEKR